MKDKKYCICCESAWHIDRCLGKEIVNQKPPDYFKHFFDLRREFKKSFKLSVNLLQMLDFLEIKAGFLFSGNDYCVVISKILTEMLKRGHYFLTPEKSVFSEESVVVKLRGLPWQATESDILEFFYPLKVTAVDIVFNNQGSATGEAYTTFDSAESAKKSLEKDNQAMGHRYIELFPSSFEELNQTRNNMKKNLLSTAIMRVRGLPFDVNTSDILLFFNGLDIIEGGIYIEKDEGNVPTGTAYVEFPTVFVLNEALKRNKEKMGKRYIELFRSSKEELFSKFKFEKTPITVSNFIIKFENFPSSSNEEDIANFLHGVDILPQGIHLIFNEKNESTGEGFIQVWNEDDLIESLKRDSEQFKNNKIRISASTPEELLNFMEPPPITNTLRFDPLEQMNFYQIRDLFKDYRLQKKGIELKNDHVLIKFISEEEALKVYQEKGNSKGRLSFC